MDVELVFAGGDRLYIHAGLVSRCETLSDVHADDHMASFEWPQTGRPMTIVVDPRARFGVACATMVLTMIDADPARDDGARMAAAIGAVHREGLVPELLRAASFLGVTSVITAVTDFLVRVAPTMSGDEMCALNGLRPDLSAEARRDAEERNRWFALTAPAVLNATPPSSSLATPSLTPGV